MQLIITITVILTAELLVIASIVLLLIYYFTSIQGVSLWNTLYRSGKCVLM